MLQGTPGRRDIDEACAAFNIPAGSVEGPENSEEELQLWPEHAIPVAIFQRMAGQWRMGPGGPIALDYTALPVVCAALGVGRKAMRHAFEPLRVMEAEALAWVAEREQ